MCLSSGSSWLHRAIFVLISVFCLSSSPDVAAVLLTTNSDRITGCVDAPDGMTADQTCRYMGFINHNPSRTACNVQGGGLVRVLQCAVCPIGWERFYRNFQWRCRMRCPAGFQVSDEGPCEPDPIDPPPLDACPASTHGSNPIDHSEGSKLLTEVDFVGSGPFPLRFERHYHSKQNFSQRMANHLELYGPNLADSERVPPVQAELFEQPGLYLETGTYNRPPPGRVVLPQLEARNIPAKYYDNLGSGGVAQWRHSFERRMLLWPTSEVSNGAPLRRMMLVQPNGRDINFYADSSINAFAAGSDRHGSAVLLDSPLDGGDGTIQLSRPDGLVELYAADDGRLLKITDPEGHEHRLFYSADTIKQLLYVEDDFGNGLGFDYDASGRLSRLTASSSVSGNGGEPLEYYAVDYSHAGDTDLYSSVRYPDSAQPRTYLYEDTRFSRALTGVVDENGDRARTYTYLESGLATSTERGTVGNSFTVDYDQRYRTLTNPLGHARLSWYSDSSLSRILSEERLQSANASYGLTAYEYDIHGNLSASIDPRGTRTTYVHDLSGRELSRTEAEGTPQARTIQRSWNIRGQQTRIETELRLVAIDYGNDGLPDSRVETDKSSYNAGSRTWTYTYYETGPAAGLLHVEDGPRTDAPDITTYEYNDRGLLSRVTNALGQVTEITDYDLWGKPTRVVDANGVATTMTYTARGWLDTVTVDGLATTDFDYDSVGQLVATTLPNGVVSYYSYNDAGQLTGISNGLGESIAFVLDAAGNITGTDIRGGSGSLLYRQQQVFDELSRLRNQLGSNGQDYAHDYDLNDNRTSSDDALDHLTSRVYDPLNRLSTVTDALGGVVRYTYDQHDNITSVVDQEGVTTTYTYDGFDNLREEVSPNTGTTVYSYDAADNRIQKLDARGVQSQYAYDALNRLTAVSYPADPALDVVYNYDATDAGNKGVGRLTGMQDSAGSASYAYNSLGHMTGKTVTLDGVAYYWQMAHDAAGKMTLLTYPSGRQLRYLRDAEGRVSDVYTRASASEPELPVATSMAYNAYGPVAGYTLGNLLETTMSYDQDYRVTNISTEGASAVFARGYSHDVTDNINAILNEIDPSGDQAFSYDGLYRLESATGSYGVLDYGLDGSGNRLSKTRQEGGSTIADTYSYEAGSQRLLSVESLLDGVLSGSRSFSYDQNGNPLLLTAADGRELTYVYGDHNRPISVSDGNGLLATYSYDGIGQRRIKTLADGTITHFHYADNGQLLAETDATGAVIREYLYADGMRLAMVTAGGSSTAPEEAIVDSEDPQVVATGNWRNSTAVSGYLGANYRVHEANGPVEGGIIVDNGDPGFSTTGIWTASTAINGYLGADYQHHYANGASPDALTLDNGSAVAVGNWPTSTSVGGYEGANYQFHPAGSGENTMTWSTSVAPGRYKVFARWTSHGNRASNATYEIIALDAQQLPTVNTVSVSQRAGGGQYQLLGEFEFGDTASISLSDAADGYVIADGIRLEPLDAAPNEAIWALTADETTEYFLDLRWTAHPNRASDAQYTSRRDGYPDAVYTADQRQGNGEWSTAATLNLAAGETVTVSLSDRANGYVIADAVRLVRTDEARNQLTWPLDVQIAGDYRLEALWTSHPNRASNASFVVQTTAGQQTVTVNQRSGGGGWQPLGTFALDGSSRVSVSDDADGYVVADAIRVVWADTSSNQQALSGSGSQVVYFHNDHLGTPQVITDQSQQVVWQGDYLPFGEVIPVVESVENLVRFPGQYYDVETGVHYNYFRDYDPSTGRYIQPDPIGLMGGLNRFTYVRNAPLDNLDPLGLVSVSAGLEMSFMSGPAGASASATLGIDSAGQICFQVTSCARAGAGESYGAGAILEIGSGTFSEGDSASAGSFCEAGAGGFGGGSLEAGDGGIGFSLNSKGGVGYGAAAGGQACVTRTFCARVK